ncbi:hypothetical protein HYALB_00003956 [Hymenoscyphus albidus]|uniref:Uncharacterized protein n=1 Tax=Hymenoscyphus albidus TaxID=595503 RepID=A0A9N9LXP7_9HELO|nr:hypothetical protein HYALB_00003956 [Hymenoscyphus albidus]
MTAWAKAFDSWFFADSLHDTLVELVFLEDPEQPRAYFETDTVDGHEANTIFINLRSSSREIEEWPEYKGTFEEFYIAALLHEMVHAFCNIYHCQKTCCKEQTWHPSTGAIGCDGHGHPFSEGSKCLLDASVAEGLSWAVDPIALGLGDSVVFFYVYKPLATRREAIGELERTG